MIVPLPPTLRLALAISVAVEQRSRQATLHGLRLLWELADSDQQAEQAACQISLGLDGAGRHWLGCLRCEEPATA